MLILHYKWKVDLNGTRTKMVKKKYVPLHSLFWNVDKSWRCFWSSGTAYATVAYPAGVGGGHEELPEQLTGVPLLAVLGGQSSKGKAMGHVNWLMELRTCDPARNAYSVAATLLSMDLAVAMWVRHWNCRNRSVWSLERCKKCGVLVWWCNWGWKSFGGPSRKSTEVFSVLVGVQALALEKASTCMHSSEKAEKRKL